MWSVSLLKCFGLNVLALFKASSKSSNSVTPIKKSCLSKESTIVFGGHLYVPQKHLNVVLQLLSFPFLMPLL